jgi:hypothetical protein
VPLSLGSDLTIHAVAAAASGCAAGSVCVFACAAGLCMCSGAGDGSISFWTATGGGGGGGARDEPAPLQCDSQHQLPGCASPRGWPASHQSDDDDASASSSSSFSLASVEGQPHLVLVSYPALTAAGAAATAIALCVLS